MKNRIRRLIAMITLALTIGATLTSCGKSSSSTHPAQTQIPQETLDQVAQQSASVALSGGALGSARTLLALSFPTSPGARRARPASVGTVETDSSSSSYSLHVYNLAGQEVDWGTVTADEISHVAMAWDIYAQQTTDSLSFLIHLAEAFDVTGFPTAQPRWVMSGTGSMLMDWDYLSGIYHSIGHYLGNHQFSGVAFEKSGTPTYPVAGSITMHWDVSWNYTAGAQHSTGTQTVDAVMTFDGSPYADLTVAGVHYKVNLVTGEVTRVTA